MGAWLRAIGFYRGFLLVSFMPVSLGAAVGWWQSGHFSLPLFLLTLAAVWCFHVGTNLTNDYYDHLSGTDDINQVKTPFSGGTRVIQEELIEPERIKQAGLAAFAAGVPLFLILAWLSGWFVIALMVFGFLSGYFYSAKPVWLAYRGWGEVMIALTFGPAMALTGSYAQSGQISLTVFFAGLLVGLWAAAIITINEIPDYVADKAAGKRNLVVRFGVQAGLMLWAAALYTCLGLLLAAVFFGWLPRQAVLALVALPVVIRLTDKARRGIENLDDLIALCGGTIKGEIFFWALLTAGTLAAGWLENTT